jgi:hypothetical protein
MVKKLYRCVLCAVLPAVLFYGLALFGLQLTGYEILEIIRDAPQQTDSSSFLGFLSNIGVWLWISSAAISLFAATSSRAKFLGQPRELALLLGGFSLALGFDDLFLIHDRYINQYICYAGYAVGALFLVVRHFRIIFSANGIGFFMAGALLALSILTDIVQYDLPFAHHHVQGFEEGFKFAGAATWLYFCCGIATSLLCGTSPPAE